MELEWLNTPKNEWINEDSIFCWDGWRSHLIMHLRNSWFLLHFCRKVLPSQHTAYVPFRFLNYIYNELLCIYLEVKDTLFLQYHICPQSQYFFIFMSDGNFHDIFLKYTHLREYHGETQLVVSSFSPVMDNTIKFSIFGTRIPHKPVTTNIAFFDSEFPV